MAEDELTADDIKMEEQTHWGVCKYCDEGFYTTQEANWNHPVCDRCWKENGYSE